MSTQAKEDRSAADFGANEWMVEELYEKYLQDKNSVDPAWWDFFADFLPPGSADVPSSDVTAGTVDPLPEGQGTRGEQAPAHAPAAEAADAPRTRTTTAAAHREREEQHTPYLRSDLPPAPPVAAIPARTFYATLLDEERADVDAQDVTEKLKGVPALRDYAYGSILGLAEAARGNDPFGYRAEFLRLVGLAAGFSGEKAE